MIGNPEFIKNIQLQINAVKMVLMPAVLGMIFIVVYLMNADSYKPVEYAMQVASLVLLGVIVFVWGTKMAVESLAGEFNDKTWDSQRMTAIDPWNLAWGKLFGSTLFAWYGGLFCLLVFTVSSFFSPKSYRFLELLLAWYFAAFHTAIDCFEKRKKKGFLFTIGDEPTLPDIPVKDLKAIMGNGQYEPSYATTLLDKARQSYHVYHLHIKQTYAGSMQETMDGWKQLLGDHLIILEDHKEVSTVLPQIIADVVHEDSTIDTSSDSETKIIL